MQRQKKVVGERIEPTMFEPSARIKSKIQRPLLDSGMALKCFLRHQLRRPIQWYLRLHPRAGWIAASGSSTSPRGHTLRPTSSEPPPYCGASFEILVTWFSQLLMTIELRSIRCFAGRHQKGAQTQSRGTEAGYHSFPRILFQKTLKLAGKLLSIKG